jgi:hypothetical protein
MTQFIENNKLSLLLQIIDLMMTDPLAVLGTSHFRNAQLHPIRCNHAPAATGAQYACGHHGLDS